MKALVLAAGRGSRMRPLTDHQPKPLLQVRGQPLMAWPMQALARAGAQMIVVNTDWLGHQIEAHFGDRLTGSTLTGRPINVPIRYSHEGQDFGGALETLGGIARALPWLAERADDGFWVVAGDVFMPDFNFQVPALGDHLGQLWLVPNPAHHPQGDFALAATGQLLNDGPGLERLTFSGVGYYRRALFEPPWCAVVPGNPGGEKAPLAPLLRRAADNGLMRGSRWAGPWTDVGTPERLADINAASNPIDSTRTHSVSTGEPP